MERRARVRLGIAATVAATLGLAACGGQDKDSAAPAPSRAGASASATGSPAPSPSPSAPSATPSTPSASATAKPGATPTYTPTPANANPTVELPGGGATILDKYRVVAYYGGPDGPALGVLGRGSPDEAAQAVIARSKGWDSYGQVQPALELITTVVQGSPGPDGTWSLGIPPEQVQKYLDAAHKYKLLLILDLQPGHGEFLPQVKRYEKFIKDPSVSVALDPEWKMWPGQTPAVEIGHALAREVNPVGEYLSGLVKANNLPDKLFVLHEFNTSMLPDRYKIDEFPGLERVIHADGQGAPDVKRGSYKALHIPGSSYGAGFKLFFTKDTRVMSPAETMSLHPRPRLITFQ